MCSASIESLDTYAEPTLYTVRQLAEKYGVSDRTVWRWIRKGAVQVVRKAPRTGVRVIDAPSKD